MHATVHTPTRRQTRNGKRFSLLQSDSVSDAKNDATRDKNVAVLKMIAFPIALAYALVCFGNDQIVGLITNAHFKLSRGKFSWVNYFIRYSSKSRMNKNCTVFGCWANISYFYPAMN